MIFDDSEKAVSGLYDNGLSVGIMIMDNNSEEVMSRKDNIG